MNVLPAAGMPACAPAPAFALCASARKPPAGKSRSDSPLSRWRVDYQLIRNLVYEGVVFGDASVDFFAVVEVIGERRGDIRQALACAAWRFQR